MLRRMGLHPFEWVTAAALLTAWLLLTAMGHPMRGDSVLDTLRAMLAVLPAALLLGVALQAYHHWSENLPLRPYLQRVLTLSWALLWLRLWLACWVVSFAYFWVKVYVPLIHEGSFDAMLLQLDRVVHLGTSPNEAVVGLLRGTPLVGWIDTWYSVWLASVVWSLAFFAASPDSLLRRRVVLSCLLLWIFGAAVYLLVPALGPIYVQPETWSQLRAAMPETAQSQALLQANYEAVLESRGGGPAAFDHRFGVAALPSLHVGFHVLFALWAWHQARVVRVVFVGMAALTFVGSILTGWHYAVDGYLGAGLAVACWRGAIRLERVNTSEHHQDDAAAHAAEEPLERETTETAPS